ncbi:HAD-IIA family hydrolase [Fodinicola acaciae]|uniref:HAD-IIA family hydrolase n=1 Tax=Fodinicola acaciae TaxID=2681555 RepID=UPI001C9E27C0|nr:HAD-IIA family hydrolase [Fodinicola acaciae]
MALLDLDGVVYTGEEPVPHAAEALAEARNRGMKLEFVTNNASRRPDAVVALLAKVGVPAEVDAVVTSAQAAASSLADRLPAGAEVLIIGSDALAAEVADVGLAPVRATTEKTVAVAQGFGREVGWLDLAEGAVALRQGALWVASNGDSTLPSPRGPLPGNGALVQALATGSGRRPDEVVGKPHPRLHQESITRSRARRPLVVGDRLDTDIEGANNAGTDSLLVLSGVTTAAEFLAAEPKHRPTYVATDVRGLLVPHAAPETAGEVVRCGGWTVRVGDDLTLSGSGDPLDALRALGAAAWSAAATSVRADGSGADQALSVLGLSAPRGN